MKIAQEYDDMRQKGVSEVSDIRLSYPEATMNSQIDLGGLHGIPILIKDVINTDPALGKIARLIQISL
jgi:Asp-tRNA(Asn)/Glu-tRNA(Gln) amidotransferase A subunit family amidase